MGSIRSCSMQLPCAMLRQCPPPARGLLLPDTFLPYAHALARGAVTLENRMDDEDLNPDPTDAGAAPATAISSPNPGAVIEALAPQTPAYLALRRALPSYRATAGAPEAAKAMPGHTLVADGAAKLK